MSMMALQHASERLRDNDEVVREAIQKNVLALQHASERLRDNEEVVLMAVRQKGRALQHASERLRDNEEVVREAIQKNAFALQHASEKLRDDKQIVLMAVRQRGGALWCASERLRDDREVVLAAVTGGNNTSAFEWASDRLKADYDFVFSALRTDYMCLKWASRALRDDESIIIEAVMSKNLYYEDDTESDTEEEDEEEEEEEEDEEDREKNWYIYRNHVKRKSKFVSDSGAVFFASARLKDDMEFMLKVMRHEKSFENHFNPAFYYASERLKGIMKVEAPNPLESPLKNTYVLYEEETEDIENAIRRLEDYQRRVLAAFSCAAFDSEIKGAYGVAALFRGLLMP